MSGRRWYSPQLSRQLISQLYRQAKAERIPMTKLANRIIEQGLGSNHSAELAVFNENRIDQDSEQK
jgi:hypothetical protein